MCKYVCVCACVCMCVYVCECVCVCTRLVRPCVFSGAQRFIMVLNYKVNDLLITNVIDCSGWLRQPFVIISNG